MKSLLALLLAATLAGCATAPEPVAMHNDRRTGTDYSPYRSIATAIQCDDCRR